MPIQIPLPSLGRRKERTKAAFPNGLAEIRAKGEREKRQKFKQDLLKIAVLGVSHVRYFFEPSGSIFLFPGFLDTAIGKPLGTCASHKFESSAVDWESACFKRTEFSFSVSVGNYLFFVWRVVSPPNSISLRPDWQNNRKMELFSSFEERVWETGHTGQNRRKRNRDVPFFKRRKKWIMSFHTKEFIAPFSLPNRMRKYLRVETFFIPSWFLSGKGGGGYVVKPKGRRKTTAVELFFWVILLGDGEEGKTNEYRSPCKEREAGRWGGQWRRRKKVLGKGRFAIAELFCRNQNNLAVPCPQHRTAILQNCLVQKYAFILAWSPCQPFPARSGWSGIVFHGMFGKQLGERGKGKSSSIRS